MSKSDWQIIQRWAGVKADGVAGPKTARGIIAKAGLNAGNVTGAGKNISKIFIHCTATREGSDVDAATIRRWHKAQGWKDIGYHFVIRLDGEIEKGRAENVTGSHVRGQNTGSIGVVYAGGLDYDGKSKDTRTPAQLIAMRELVAELMAAYPKTKVLGHRDAPAAKDCPCFDVSQWLEREGLA